MNSLNIKSIQFLQRQTASLLIYQSVLKGEIAQTFNQILSALGQSDPDPLVCLQIYGQWFRTLAVHHTSWQNYLIDAIYKDSNPFSQRLQTQELRSLPPSLILAVKHDLNILQSLYNCSSQQVGEWVGAIAGISQPILWEVPQEIDHFFGDNWADSIDQLADYYQQQGIGIFSQYRAFRWQNQTLIGIPHPDAINLADLAAYNFPRQTLIKNTQFLLSGFRALNVLLYGSRGTGKSSLIKALVNEYHSKRLRLIEVTKSALQDLPMIVEMLRNQPYKFIIFVDDLSFEEDDNDFKSLKVVLEGNITGKPENVVVYATSNRRHLVREFFADRPRPIDADEINAWDTVQEKLSFSDRFGLTLTFEPPDQDTYLQIVTHLASQLKLNITDEELQFKALQWATRNNGRSGRTAKQFIDFLQAELSFQ
jgi:uncharacterized protein